MEFQKFEKKHIETAADVFFNVFRNPPWNYDWILRDNIIRYFSDLYNTPNFKGFVLADKNALPAVCLGIVNDYFLTPNYDIKEIFTAPEQQGQGCGSKLLAEIEAELARSEIYTVTLLTQKNIAAYDFYVKNGYSTMPLTVHMSKFF